MPLPPSTMNHCTIPPVCVAAAIILRKMLHLAKTPKERAKWKDRLDQVHLELERQAERSQ